MAETTSGSRERLKEYLAGLSETFDLVVVDFTSIKSFNGAAVLRVHTTHATPIA